MSPIPVDEAIYSGAEGWTSPARKAFSITPHDTNLLSNLTRGIYVGGSGDIVLVMADDGDTSVTFFGAVAGTLLPIRVARVLATGTTATNLVGVY